MKIVATTEKGYLLDASLDEVANLLGYYSQYQCKHETEVGRLKAGATIDVHGMFQQLYKMAKLRAELSATAEGLERAAATVKLVCPVIEEVTKS